MAKSQSSKADYSTRESIFNWVNGKYGDGSIMVLGDQKAMDVETISTGSLSLDKALGGGMPRGRIIEVFGKESSGKTTMALQVAAAAQKEGGNVSMIDAEHAFDPEWAKRLGVNPDTMAVCQPSSGEEGLTICEALVRGKHDDVIIVDSVAALVPQKELEGEIGDSHVALQARMMSQALRKMTGAINGSRAVVIFINQIRQKIGVSFGSPNVTPGGTALKFYCSQRIEITNIGGVKEGEERIGHNVRAKVVKNKIAPPFREGNFELMHGVNGCPAGISVAGELIDMGKDAKVIKQSGSWISFGDKKLGQGREKARAKLNENPDLMEEVKKAIAAKS